METLGLLIAEDDRFILHDLKTIIDWQTEGFELITASNGRQGLARFQEHHPALVLTDVRMPFMDGIEMFTAIRRLDPHVQGLFLSAFDDYSFVREGLRSGAWDYILKSDISPELILQKVRELRENYWAVSGRVVNGEPEGAVLVRKAMDFIREHCGDPALKNADIARGLGVSERKLSELFRTERGQTLNDHITEIRLAEAKRLLTETELRIYEIAERVGYGSSAYFSTAFTRMTGLSPADYRREGQS